MRVQFGTEFAISISGQDERVSLAPGFHSVLSVKFLAIETEHVLSFTPEMAVEIVNCVLTPPTPSSTWLCIAMPVCHDQQRSPWPLMP